MTWGKVRLSKGATSVETCQTRFREPYGDSKSQDQPYLGIRSGLTASEAVAMVHSITVAPLIRVLAV